MRGSTGASMGGKVFRPRKPNRIKCNCKQCRHYNKKSDLCTWFSIWHPKRTRCIRYININSKI